MRKYESVFIKTLRPSWSFSSIGPAIFDYFVKNILFTMCTAECTYTLAILQLKDRSLDYFAHKFGLGLSTTRFLITLQFPILIFC